MKSKIFNVSLIFKDLVVLFCCLSVTLILKYCTSQEKKINTPTKTDLKDSLNQDQSTETKIDTSRGIFLIYKFGDTYADVDKKTDYLVRKNILSKREEDEGPPFGGKKSYFEYKIFTDPKFDFSKGGTYLGDQLISSEDSYLIMMLSFDYTENLLYQIKLYTGIKDDLQERINVLKDKNLSRIWEEIASKNIQALLDVYSKKYKGWIEISKKYGLNDFLYKQGNTQILLERYLYGVTVIYTDLEAQSTMKKKEKENVKKKMEENNTGI